MAVANLMDEMGKHIVLGYWPDVRQAVLFFPDAEERDRFACAYGYDPELGDYRLPMNRYRTASEAWNEADPSIVAHLSRPCRKADILDLLHDHCGIDAADHKVAEAYSKRCCTRIDPDTWLNVEHERDEALKWWELAKHDFEPTVAEVDTDALLADARETVQNAPLLTMDRIHRERLLALGAKVGISPSEMEQYPLTVPELALSALDQVAQGISQAAHEQIVFSWPVPIKDSDATALTERQANRLSRLLRDAGLDARTDLMASRFIVRIAL